ncbi:hypothetical protein BKP35_07505 [Anaerobacillus arseniciselenatis]|uniref:Uncharacterized protein n=1 Tax=Anaerobacillus arseniciselenatis TaxID=85682 RepID=A0A1S2LPB9_9BACI|nr:hypothetical protein [Anaerobacillus arseniciselenatis]OIJ14040.1 hypothetical protein BKP35_07505 [Anaerobacillus arseniciselenatis]
MRILTFSALIFLYIISNFTTSVYLYYSIGTFALLALVISFKHTRGLYRISGITFLFVATLLFIYNGLPWYTFLLYFDTMLGVLSLFLVLPFINSIIRVGLYDKNLSLLLQQGISDLSKLYRRSFLVCHFLGLFLNIATIPLLTNSLKTTLSQIPKNVAEKFYTQNLLRAYALCLVWSPLEIMVITSLDITNNEYYKLFPIIISIVLIIILSDWILSSFKHKSLQIEVDFKTEILYKSVYKKILQMVSMLVILVLIVTIFQHLANQGFLLSVVIMLIPVSLLWAFLIKKIKRYFLYTIPHWKERTKGLPNYFFMFLSAGLFVEMLSLSELLSFLQDTFSVLSEKTLLFYLTIGAFFLFTSFIGFHPLVSLTLITELLNPVLAEVSSISLTIVLITCSLSTVLYSPYNLSVSILAEQLKLNPYKLGMWNLLFAIYFMLVSIFIAYFITLIF